eukprot:366250-Chlamydomonas_euryale.AAC.10
MARTGLTFTPTLVCTIQASTGAARICAQQRDRPPRRRNAHVRHAWLGQGRDGAITLHALYGKPSRPADVPPGASTKTGHTSASVTVSEPAAAAAAAGIRRAECGASSGTSRSAHKAAVTTDRARRP